jgi:hypothetical protein
MLQVFFFIVKYIFSIYKYSPINITHHLLSIVCLLSTLSKHSFRHFSVTHHLLLDSTYCGLRSTSIFSLAIHKAGPFFKKLVIKFKNRKETVDELKYANPSHGKDTHG